MNLNMHAIGWQMNLNSTVGQMSQFSRQSFASSEVLSPQGPYRSKLQHIHFNRHRTLDVQLQRFQSLQHRQCPDPRSTNCATNLGSAANASANSCYKSDDNDYRNMACRQS